MCWSVHEQVQKRKLYRGVERQKVWNRKEKESDAEEERSVWEKQKDGEKRAKASRVEREGERERGLPLRRAREDGELKGFDITTVYVTVLNTNFGNAMQTALHM